MADRTEVEWRFDAVDLVSVERWVEAHTSGALSPVLRGTIIHTDAYADTPDRRFERAGYSLRLRKTATNPRRAEATLKALSHRDSDARARREVTEELCGSTVAVAIAAGGDVGTRLRAVAGTVPIEESFSIRTKRTIYDLMQDGAAAAELALDESVVRSGGRQRARLRRVEVEVRRATPDLAGFVERMASACRLSAALHSKFEVGVIASGLGEAKIDLGPLDVAPDIRMATFALVTVRRHVAAMLDAEPAARLGDDIEGVHKMRVALRRVRAAFRVFGPHLPAELTTRDADFKRLSDTLGEVRDLDVQLAELEVEGLDALRTVLEAKRHTAREGLLAYLDSPSYASFRTRIERTLRTRRGSRSSPLAKAVLPDVIEETHAKMRKRAKRIGANAPAADLHTLRRRTRRLRYLLEFAAPLYEGRLGAMIKRLVAMQDVLGEHQDAIVAIDHMRELATGTDELTPMTIFEMGRVAERRTKTLAKTADKLASRVDRATGRTWKKTKNALDAARPPEPGVLPSSQP